MTAQRTRYRLFIPFLLALGTLIVPEPAHSQVAAGSWEGVLNFGDQPRALLVTLKHSDGRWSGHFSYPGEGIAEMPLHAVAIAGDSIQFTLRPGYIFRGVFTSTGEAGSRDGSGERMSGEATLDGRTFPGELARPGSPLAERLALRVREAIEAARNLPLVEVARGTAAERVDSAALARLLEAASAAHSDAVVVLHDGEVVGEWYRGGESKRIEAMSVTKSIVNLAFGRLVTLGAIRSIDLPVSTYYPEWREGEKSRITIRHLLSHTSGLRSNPTPEIYASSDFVRFALGADVTSEPGTRFTYNNTAVNLLAGIFESAAGKRMDLFLRDDLFAKLGITDFNWELDSAGNPHAMSGLQIHAADLAKLGQLSLDRGRWQGEQLIAESWFDESLRAAIELEPLSGLLWWLIPDGEMSLVIDAENIRALRDVGVDDAFLAQAERLQGRYGSGYELLAAYASVFGDDWRPTIMEALGPHGNLLFRREIGEIIGYNANGYLGQYIVVYPAERLVAVRMVTNSAAYDEATDGFIEIEKLVRALRR